MLDERESDRMVMQIEAQMKRLKDAPPSITLPGKGAPACFAANHDWPHPPAVLLDPIPPFKALARNQ